jgi:hypothetical protein
VYDLEIHRVAGMFDLFVLLIFGVRVDRRGLSFVLKRIIS